MKNLTNHLLGHYQLEELIGSGGYAHVFKAYDVFLDRDVAVKVLKSPINPNDFESVYQCALEARISVHLSHPHIVNVIDFNIQGTTAYIVMEYAKNGSLLDIHPQGERLELDIILNYLEQITEALAYIHEHNFVHQDVKPSNILLGDNNEILIGDFGTVEILRQTASEAMPSFIGTIRYAAPERYTNELPTAASDIYSLAVMIFEWITGEPLFTGSESQIIRKHRFVSPSTRRMSILGIKPSIQNVLLKALDKNPNRRHQKVREFYQALKEAVEETNEQSNKWAETAYISFTSGLASLLMSLAIAVIDVKLITFLLILQLSLIIIFLFVALILKNWITICFVLTSLLVATLISFLLGSSSLFYLVLPGSLFVSTLISCLQSYRS